MSSDYLTIKQVAALHGCHPATVRRAIHRDDFPGAVLAELGALSVWHIPRGAAYKWQPRPVGWTKGRKRTAQQD